MLLRTGSIKISSGARPLIKGGSLPVDQTLDHTPWLSDIGFSAVIDFACTPRRQTIQSQTSSIEGFTP
jgi:hypothetical protein